MGLYQHCRRGNADEGCTRGLLEQFHFPFAPLLDAELKKSKLNETCNVVILPQDSTSSTGRRPTARSSCC